MRRRSTLPSVRRVGAVVGALALGVLPACSPPGVEGETTVTGVSEHPRHGGAGDNGNNGNNGSNGNNDVGIVRDDYGVPHVYAKDRHGLFWGAGYTQAQDRLVQLELTRRNVEGNLAELLGPSLLPQDQAIRTFYYTPAELRTQLLSLPKSEQEALQSFADGINSYLAEAYASDKSAKEMVPYGLYGLSRKGRMVSRNMDHHRGALDRSNDSGCWQARIAAHCGVGSKGAGPCNSSSGPIPQHT